MVDSQLQISLFGEFGLIYGGKPAPSFNGDRPISLLAYLLLNRHTAVSRQHLAFTMWPDSSDSQARANLRNLFYTLRQTLPNADTFLAADSMTLQWRMDANFSLDVAEFEAALASAKTAVSDADKMNDLETAVSYYKGDLLPGNYDDWIIPRREELRQAYLDALHQLVRLLEQAGDYRAAARTSQRLIQHDPLDEPAYVQLMRLHALSGDRAGVRRVYEQCVTMLQRELEVGPSSATQAAYEQFVRWEAPIEAVPMPVPEPEIQPIVSTVRPFTLPNPATPFIGREAELAHIAELLADPTCRLLTIVGAGGMGKTRLALQTAVGHQPVFTDGVVWVSLNGVPTADQLPTTNSEALQYRLSGTGNGEAELLTMLANRRLLLVLDNFEHLLPEIDFLEQLVRRTTAVKLLITSRLALELPEEWRFDLGELPLPDKQATASLTNNSAVQLFVQSARRAASNVTLTEADYPAIAQICQLVGGMPLGIELAASWMRLLSCAEIAQEIEKSLDFLTVNNRQLPPRHRSLRAVFEYSWALLSPDERQILARLSIFEGGFAREAAVQVAGADLPQLLLLADRSLVQRTAVGRYNLHNLIRQYAHEHLQADIPVFMETAQRHSDYYLQWLADQEDTIRGAAQKEVLTAVATDLTNIQVAGEWGVMHQSFDLICRAAFPLFYFYDLRGMYHHGESIFRQAIERLEQNSETSSRAAQIAMAAIRTNHAYFILRLGRATAAEATLREVAATLKTLADETILSYTLRYLALAASTHGHMDEAIQLMQQSLTIASQHERQWEIAITQAYMGMIYHDKGSLSDALHYLTEAVANGRRLKESRVLAFSLLNLGRTQIELGQMEIASEQFVEAIALAEDTQDTYSANMAYWMLGIAKLRQGDLTAARELYQKSRDSFALTNDRIGVERISVSIGFLEMDLGNFDEAKAYFLATLQTKREHVLLYILGAVVGLATLYTLFEADKTVALVWLLTALHHPNLEQKMRQRVETLLAELEGQLSPAQLAWAQQEAERHTLPTVVADILTYYA